MTRRPYQHLPPELRDAILNARAEMSMLNISKKLRVPFGTVKSVIGRAVRAGDPRAAPLPPEVVRARCFAGMIEGVRRPEVRAKISEGNRRRYARERGETWAERQEREAAQYEDIEVPAWVERAGLELEYLAIAETRGEEDAAAHCRRLKASAPCPAGAQRRVAAAGVVGASNRIARSDDMAPRVLPRPGASNLAQAVQPARRVLSGEAA